MFQFDNSYCPISRRSIEQHFVLYEFFVTMNALLFCGVLAIINALFRRRTLVIVDALFTCCDELELLLCSLRGGVLICSSRAQQ